MEIHCRERKREDVRRTVLSYAGAERGVEKGWGERRKEERLFPREARNAVVYAYSLCAGCVPPAE